MIHEIRRLNLETLLGNAGNAPKCLSLVDAIEISKFQELLVRWSGCGMLPSLSPGSADGGTDYSFYNPFTSRFTSESETTNFLRGMDRRVRSGHPVGLDYSEIDEDFVGSNATLFFHVRH